MKRIVTLALVIFTAVAINAQSTSFKQFYKTHKKEAEVSLNVPGFIARMFIDSDDLGEEEILIKKARNFKVLTFSEQVDEVSKDFTTFIEESKLKSLVRTKDGGDKAEIYFLEKKDKIKEIVIMTADKGDELVLLGLKTNLTKDEFRSMISEMEKS